MKSSIVLPIVAVLAVVLVLSCSKNDNTPGGGNGGTGLKGKLLAGGDPLLFQSCYCAQ